LNISRRLSSCLIFATVFARAWIFCAALACLGCGRPTSPGAGGGERGGCPGRSTRGPAGEHCAGLLAGGPLGRPVRNATADDSMSSTPLIAARPRRAVPRAILFGDEIVPCLVLRVFLQCAFVRAYNSMLSTFRTLAHLLLLSASVAAFPVQSAIGSASPPLHVRSSVCSLQVSDARARGWASCNFAHVCARFACISINMWHFNGNVEIASRGEYAWPCLQAHAGAAQLGRRGFLLAAGIFFSPFRFCIRQADILIVYYICVNSSLTNVEQS